MKKTLILIIAGLILIPVSIFSQQKAEKKNSRVVYHKLDGSTIVVDRNENKVSGDAATVGLKVLFEGEQEPPKKYKKGIYKSLDNRVLESFDMKVWKKSGVSPEASINPIKKHQSASELNLRLGPNVTDELFKIILYPEQEGYLNISICNLLGSMKHDIYNGKADRREYEFNVNLKELRMTKGVVVVKIDYNNQIILRRVILN